MALRAGIEYNESVLRLACPKCRGPFPIAREDLTCSSCGAGGKYVDGIPCFADAERYEGEISLAEMQRVNRLAEEIGWRAAIAEALPGESPAICDESRADFRHLWDLEPSAAVLDIGDHWGTIAAALGDAFAHVTVVENILERARFISIRTQQLKLPVDVICADYFSLPLAPGQFDAIALNMTLLARMPGAEGDYRELQLRLLRFLHEALKSSGFVCVGVENRFSWRRLLRRSRRRKSEDAVPMRSLAAYRALFREAGYGTVHMYHSWNGCAAPGVLLPLRNRAALRHFAGLCHFTWPRSWALHAAAVTGFWARCAPEVILLAVKS